MKMNIMIIFICASEVQVTEGMTPSIASTTLMIIEKLCLWCHFQLSSAQHALGPQYNALVTSIKCMNDIDNNTFWLVISSHLVMQRKFNSS